MPDPAPLDQNGLRAFGSVLTLPCRHHDAPPGQPCWVVQPDRPDQPDHRALCGRRIRARLGSR